MSFEEWLGDYELPAKVKTKWCPECQEVLPEQCFHKNKATRDKLAKVCKRCSLVNVNTCLLYTSPSPRDGLLSRMPSSA